MIRRLLIANRGEIAIRIARTAREMGIRPFGVYSRADADAPHRRVMEDSVDIGGPLPSESYLDIDAILRAAHETKVDAIHPGYGFLSENPHFARRCQEEGLLFVGPPAQAMTLSGDKIASRRAMAEAGVPVTRGVDRVIRSAEEARDIADRLGYPVLFKATAGGGGIGMSRVDSPKAVAKAFEAARSIALANFGNPDLFLEAYIPRARHIEVQVLLVPRGRGVHLGERECSVQRRHQKLVEETPSPVVDPIQRRRIGELALKALRGLGYVNAGTVEFLWHRGRFTFNEINARLQVEHPVTEAVTGIDLVRQQILIASGEPPDISQNEISFHGHALEARINAEDPLRNFLPSPGRVVAYHEPSGPGVRVDSGVAAGSEVPPFYDPLLAKLIVHGRSRTDSLHRMAGALDGYEIRGVRTTLPFHAALLREPSFRKGVLWTTMVADRRIVERMKSRGPWEERVAALAASIASGPGPDSFRRRLNLRSAVPTRWVLAGRRETTGGGDHAVPPRRRW
ncbi:MAG: hypothetical protein A3K68_05415 [Euryarchaeota archaeon RBG_16_68_13]|nr:MAG: hypothetical protein A3K68_05415 [Euryarchaeota archaeon RBG_16_68_13]